MIFFALRNKSTTSLIRIITIYVCKRFAGSNKIIIIAAPRIPRLTQVIPYGPRPTDIVQYQPPISTYTRIYVPRPTSIRLYRNVVRSTDIDGNVTEFTGIIPNSHIPRWNNDISATVPTVPLRIEFEEWERSTPEYRQAIMNRFSPVTRPRVFDNPNFNLLFNEIITFMREYSNISTNSLRDIIHAFRSIQFEPNQIGTALYREFMLLFDRFNFAMQVDPSLILDVPFTIPISSNTDNNQPVNTTISSHTTTSSSSTRPINTYEPPVIYDNKPKPSHVNNDAENTTSSSQTTITNIPKDTKIIENLSASDITDEDLIKELKSRDMAKEDKNKTTVSVKTESDDIIIVGKSNFNIKITPLGQAYLKLVEDITYIPNISDPNKENIEYKIAVLPIGDNNAFITSGKQKHLVVTYNKSNDEYHIIGYLTSKASGTFISDKQFKVYQDEIISGTFENNTKQKKQYFMELENAESIKKEDLIFIKGGSEYIKDMNLTFTFDVTSNKLSKIAYHIFDSKGHTKQQLIDTCIMHDNNVKKWKQHPKTKDQIKMEEANKVKQKAELEEKKKNKFKTNLGKENTEEN